MDAIKTHIMHSFFMCMFVFIRCIILIIVELDLGCQATYHAAFWCSLDLMYCPAHHSNHKPIKSPITCQAQLWQQFEILCSHWP
jgi:hypothetical protein